MTLSQLIERLKLMDRPEANLIVYDKHSDLFLGVKSLLAHKDGDIELVLENV